MDIRIHIVGWMYYEGYINDGSRGTFCQLYKLHINCKLQALSLKNKIHGKMKQNARVKCGEELSVDSTRQMN